MSYKSILIMAVVCCMGNLFAEEVLIKLYIPTEESIIHGTQIWINTDRLKEKGWESYVLRVALKVKALVSSTTWKKKNCKLFVSGDSCTGFGSFVFGSDDRGDYVGRNLKKLETPDEVCGALFMLNKKIVWKNAHNQWADLGLIKGEDDEPTFEEGRAPSE